MGGLVSSYGIDTAIKAMRGRTQSIAIFLAPPSQLASPERISNPSSEDRVGITHSTLLFSEVSRTTRRSVAQVTRTSLHWRRSRFSRAADPIRPMFQDQLVDLPNATTHILAKQGFCCFPPGIAWEFRLPSSARCCLCHSSSSCLWRQHTHLSPTHDVSDCQ